MPTHHHRAGGLRQTNKKNKRNSASKRSLDRQAGGRVAERKTFQQRAAAQSKLDRRNALQQKRDAKRQERLWTKRGVGMGMGMGAGSALPPRVVGIVGLGADAASVEGRMSALLTSQADRILPTRGTDDASTLTVKYDVHKKDGHLTILTNSTAFLPQYGSSLDAQGGGERKFVNDDAAVMAALDLCRVCDLVLFVVDGNESRPDDDVMGLDICADDYDHDAQSTNAGKSNHASQNWDHLISERGDKILSAIKAQGLPRTITVLARKLVRALDGDLDGDADIDLMTVQSAKSVRRSNIKLQADLKKYVSRFATTEFGVDNDKVVEIDLSFSTGAGDDVIERDDKTARTSWQHVQKTLAAALIRTICSTSASPSKWVSQSPRAYILSDHYHHDGGTSELHVTGYVRGMVPLNVNSLVHIPNLGTFTLKSIRKLTASTSTSRKGSIDDVNEHVVLADPAQQESLKRFATPDALDGEQNLVGFDEYDEGYDYNDNGDAEEEGESKNFARPAGWSDYQSAWLDAVDVDNDLGRDEYDHGELASELNKKPYQSEDAVDMDDANDISDTERAALLEERRKEQNDHQDFPDEVQVKEDEKARERFARYRSLKSFRKSHWDPKENLPESYASIYHFSNFKVTQRSVALDMKDTIQASRSCNGQFWGKSPLADADKTSDNDNVAMAECSDDDEDVLEGCVPSGSYVSLTIGGVSKEAFSGISPASLLSVVSLLPHENKVSVLHMGLCQGNNCDMSKEKPVKSKDLLTFRCGWRTWTGRPIFSQNNLNCGKHKFERFLPQDGCFFAASVFGPVTYTPCPVLVFREYGGQKELVATGSMIGADADRIIVKRVILTGYPVRVFKRFATVKYMFYNPDDVKWFKPAGLTTKHGLHGNIEESVGEHGTMKCLFNAPIKQHDTVCLPLYKRVFPKFAATVDGGKEDGATVRTRIDNHMLKVM